MSIFSVSIISRRSIIISNNFTNIYIYLKARLTLFDISFCYIHPCNYKLVVHICTLLCPLYN